MRGKPDPPGGAASGAAVSPVPTTGGIGVNGDVGVGAGCVSVGEGRPVAALDFSNAK